jgi:hypothetical protein
VVSCLKVIKRRAAQAAAPARGAGWTDEDDFVLSLLRRLGRSYPDMALVLGRSENALRSRVCRNWVVDPDDGFRRRSRPRRADGRGPRTTTCC